MRLFPTLSKAQIAQRMNIHEVSGMRPPKKATGGSVPSNHCFGMAVDINHPTNPFVGNQKPNAKLKKKDPARYAMYMENRSPRIIERAMRLIHHEAFDIEQVIKVPKGAGSSAGRLWEIHHRASETLAEYLRLAAAVDAKRVADLVDSLRATGDTRDLDWWKTRMTSDKANIGSWDFQHHTAPEKEGYMDLGKELVEALVGVGLLWGGSYGGAKDMMHFDLRDGSIVRPRK